MTVSGFDGLVIEAMGLGAPETDNMAGGADTAHDASEDQRASGAGSKSQPGSLCFPKKSGVLLEVARTAFPRRDSVYADGKRRSTKKPKTLNIKP